MDQFSLFQKVQAEKDWLFSMRHTLHEWPERAFHEEKTAAFIRQNLKALNLSYREAETGTIVDIFPDSEFKAAPMIALRADIDALPIKEQTDLPFASKNDGMMHACGHDTHTAMLLCAAKIISQNRAFLPGPVRLIFQPAEESGGGAVKMIEANALDGVSEIYCLHMRASLPVGCFLTKPEYIHASSDGYTIRIIGKSCHGASPHNGVDAIVIASHTVLALQDLISREIGAWDKAVLTLGKIDGGTARNIICGEVLLEGTLRTLDEDLRNRLKRRIAEVCEGIAHTLRGNAEVTFSKGYCPCYNNPKTTAHAIEEIKKIFGENAIELLPQASMGSEDFGFYQQIIPGTKLYLGTGYKEDIHTPYFRVNEETLPYGTTLLCSLALFNRQY